MKVGRWHKAQIIGSLEQKGACSRDNRQITPIVSVARVLPCSLRNNGIIGSNGNPRQAVDGRAAGNAIKAIDKLGAEQADNGISRRIVAGTARCIFRHGRQ